MTNLTGHNTDPFARHSTGRGDTAQATIRPADPLLAAERLAGIAAEHRGASEQGRTIAQPVVDGLIASGLASLIGPTALGGQAARPSTLIDAIAIVSAADASVGWCLAIGAGINHFSGYLPEAAARELYLDLDEPGCGVFAPTGRGRRTDAGYELSGRWEFTSGCEISSVQACGMFVVDADGIPEMGPDGMPALRLAFIPSSSVEIVDTWNATGLRATGSHDTVVSKVVVPFDHTITFGDTSWAEDAIFRVPLFCVLASCLASVALGVGRAARTLMEARVQAEHAAPPVPGPRPRFSDNPVAQIELGRASVRLSAAHSLLVSSLEACYEAGEHGRPVDRESIALVGLACREAMVASAGMVDAACQIAGSSSVREGAPLERLRRDIDTLRKHQLFSTTHEAPLARQLSGIPTVAFPFLITPISPTAR